MVTAVAKETVLDVSNAPELLRLAEEVRASNTPRVLSRDDEPLAVVVPVRRPRKAKRPTAEDLAATLSTAGAWQGLVDAVELKRQIKEARSDHRPPIEL
jgi:hypothetical protein